MLLYIVPPSLKDDLSGSENRSVIVDQPLALDCPAVGVPPPRITWYKDDVEIDVEYNPSVRILSNGRR